MQLQLSWQDPINNHQQEETLETPIALGNLRGAIPSTLSGEQVSKIILSHPQVSSYHALITEQDGEIIVVDQNLQPSIKVNGKEGNNISLKDGDCLETLPYQITIHFSASEQTIAEGEPCQRVVGFLIPRRCYRVNRSGCPHCDGGEINNDPYFLVQERNLYPNFGDYRSGWGSEYYEGEAAVLEFTEADAVSLETEAIDFEMDLGAS